MMSLFVEQIPLVNGMNPRQSRAPEHRGWDLIWNLFLILHLLFILWCLNAYCEVLDVH